MLRNGLITRKRVLATGAAGLLLTTAISPAVNAQSTTATPQTYQVKLSTLNNSNTAGTATLTLTGTQLKVAIRATGASANLPHAIHIQSGGQGICPAPAADKNNDKLISATEAIAYTGSAKVSLTTTGDTSARSALATDRMPKADDKGVIAYDRTFTLPSGVTAADMAKASIDIHGISSLYDNKATYDGTKKSDLDGNLPFEATVPASCGVFATAPAGGAATGGGALARDHSSMNTIIGITALVAAAGAVAFAVRQTRQSPTSN